MSSRHYADSFRDDHRLNSGVRETGSGSIEQLQGWLEEWGADSDTDSMDGMDHSGGMMSDEDMQSLDAATGADASRLFLEQMTVHHEGAITMAQDEVDNGQNADAVALAQTIVETQTAEIATMQELLAQL